MNCKRDGSTSEIWIESFCSTGPKSYSYRTNMYTTKDKKTGEIIAKRDEIVHAKGFSVSSEGGKHINVDTITSCIEDRDLVLTITYKDSISRDNAQNVFVQDVEKKFKFTFDKRIVLDDFKTVPFGYIF